MPTLKSQHGAHACIPCNWEAETGRFPGFIGQPGLCCELQASERPSFKQNKTKIKIDTQGSPLPFRSIHTYTHTHIQLLRCKPQSRQGTAPLLSLSYSMLLPCTVCLVSTPPSHNSCAPCPQTAITISTESKWKGADGLGQRSPDADVEGTH